MSNRGPKPKDPPRTSAAGKPTSPLALDAEGKAHWTRTVKLIESAGYLSRLDADALAHYCSLWAKWRRAEKEIKTLGPVITAPNGYLQPNPWYTIATGHLKDMKPYLDMLGLTPKARSKLRLPEPDETASKWDEFDD